MTFEDNFSKQAQSYARHRPQYPAALYAFIADAAPAHTAAWDCGTGNGQAAVALAEHFEQVFATDASPEQIAHARQHPHVTYLHAAAEHVPLADASVDAVTVATALHWFDLEGFYREVRRVLRPGGVLAVWSYFDHTINEPIDAIMRRYAREIVGPYWSQRILAVGGTYDGIPFPFREIAHPAFTIEARWNLADVVGFLYSWSATHAYINANGSNPIDRIIDELGKAWGNEEDERTVRWDLTMRIGHNTPAT